MKSTRLLANDELGVSNVNGHWHYLRSTGVVSEGWYICEWRRLLLMDIEEFDVVWRDKCRPSRAEESGCQSRVKILPSSELPP